MIDAKRHRLSLLLLVLVVALALALVGGGWAWDDSGACYWIDDGAGSSLTAP